LELRSAIPKGLSDDLLPLHPCDMFYLPPSEESGSKMKLIREMDYCTMINNCLPEEVRVIGWSPVSKNFSARFSSTHRTYRYFFLRKNLNITSMTEGAKNLIGIHDFRNICKLDVANVTNFVREIFESDILLYKENKEHPHLSIYYFQIRGVAFLWHMVRCIMSLLFMVGEGNENPSIVTNLLDISKFPAKPSYSMAEDKPLVLHSCGYANLTVYNEPKNFWHLTRHFEDIRNFHLVAAARIENALDYLKESEVRTSDLLRFVSFLSGKSATTTPSGKRKFDEIETEINNRFEHGLVDANGMIKWKEALHQISHETGLLPSSVSTRHVSIALVIASSYLFFFFLI
jgi:tRNA pseudouridine(38-40) synthase